MYQVTKTKISDIKNLRKFLMIMSVLKKKKINLIQSKKNFNPVKFN